MSEFDGEGDDELHPTHTAEEERILPHGGVVLLKAPLARYQLP